MCVRGAKSWVCGGSSTLGSRVSETSGFASFFLFVCVRVCTRNYRGARALIKEQGKVAKSVVIMMMTVGRRTVFLSMGGGDAQLQPPLSEGLFLDASASRGIRSGRSKSNRWESVFMRIIKERIMMWHKGDVFADDIRLTI